MACLMDNDGADALAWVYEPTLSRDEKYGYD